MSTSEDDESPLGEEMETKVEKKSSAASKRGPGRPPNKPTPPTLVMKGIVDNPSQAENRFEFVTGNPDMFKRLFTYFKTLKAQDIYIRFTKTDMTFFARDHSKSSRIIANIAGKYTNWFYSEDKFWLGLSRDRVDKMFASIDKSFFKLTITVRHDDPDSILFILKDADVEKEGNFKFPVSALDPDPELTDAEKEIIPEKLSGAKNEFPIQFTLTAKQFKKEVTDASNYSETISFEKLGDDYPLQLTYVNQQKVTYNGVYRNSTKIALHSSIPEGATFRCAVKLANVKSLAASMVTDSMRIYARETGDILFRSAIEDNILIVSTLTNAT
jgi:hypothetical protein